MFAPPIRVNTLRVSSPPSISASRRSISSPPMIATALMLPTARNRPCRCEPLMMATIQRTGLLPRLLRQVAGQRGELAARLGGQGPAGPLLELIEGQPTNGGVIAELPQRDITLGIRDPKGIVRFAHYRPFAELACRQQGYARAGTRSKPPPAEGEPGPGDLTGGRC